MRKPLKMKAKRELNFLIKFCQLNAIQKMLINIIMGEKQQL